MIDRTAHFARAMLMGLTIALTGCASGPTYTTLPEAEAQRLIDEQTHTLKGPGNFRLHSHYREYTRKSANYYTFGNFRCNGATVLNSVEVYRITEDDQRNVRVDASTRTECDSEASSYTLLGRHDGDRLFLRHAQKPSAVYVFRLWALPSQFSISTANRAVHHPDGVDTDFLAKPPYAGQEYFQFFAQVGAWKLADGQPVFTPYPTPQAGPQEEWRTHTISAWPAQSGTARPSFTFTNYEEIQDGVGATYTGYFPMPDELTGTRLKQSDPTPERRKVESGSYMANQLNATLGTMQRLNQQTQQGLASMQAPRSSPSNSASGTSAPATSAAPKTPSPKGTPANAASPQATASTTTPRQVTPATTAGTTGKAGVAGTAIASARASTPAPVPASAPATQAPPPEDDGCQTNVGWCASSGEKREGSDFSVGVTNTCPMRLLTKICIELKDGKWSCGQDGHQPGKRTGFWVSRDQATGRFTVRSVGSSKPGKDWVCSAKVSGWNTP